MKKRPRRFLWVLGGFFLLCIVTVAGSALSNLGAPQHSQVTGHLSEQQKALVAESLHLRQSLGDAAWPGWGQADIPVIVYNEEYAFIAGYPTPPAGWSKFPQNTARGGPWEAVDSDSLQEQPYYGQLLPDDVTPEAFTVLVGGRWVASLATKEWMLISMSEQMRQDLSPLSPHWLLARLMVGGSEGYICGLAHESFHAYVGMVAPDRLAAAEKAGAVEERYPTDEALQQDWKVEADLLVHALQAKSDQEAAELGRQFLAHRDERRTANALDSTLVDFERQREWEEGLAKYAELEIWRQASVASDYQPVSGLAGDRDFKDYSNFARHWSSQLSTIKTQANAEGDGRFYYTGMAQAFLLDRLMPGWKARALNDGVWLEDLLAEAVR